MPYNAAVSFCTHLKVVCKLAASVMLCPEQTASSAPSGCHLSPSLQTLQTVEAARGTFHLTCCLQLTIVPASFLQTLQFTVIAPGALYTCPGGVLRMAVSPLRLAPAPCLRPEGQVLPTIGQSALLLTEAPCSLLAKFPVLKAAGLNMYMCAAVPCGCVNNPAACLQTLQVIKAAGGKLPRVLYTVPTGQNPTSVITSLERKKALYQMACKHDLVIIEDDPYHYLQFPLNSGEAVELMRAAFCGLFWTLC